MLSCVSARPLSDAKPATRINAPSSRRTFVRMRLARNSRISAPSLICIVSAFFCRMAMRVSMSGGCISAVSPHSKRETSRCSKLAISLGGRSLDMTICL